MKFLKKTILLVTGINCALLASHVSAEQVVQANPNIGVYRSGDFYNKSVPYEPIVTRPSRSSAGRFNSNIIFLAEQLERNTDVEAKEFPTILSTITDLDSLGRASTLGRLIGEHMLHELHVLGWNTTDIRITNNVFVQPEGEFVLSRDLERLRKEHEAANILSGTYTVTKDGILLSLRITELKTGKLISSAQTRLIKDKFISHLLRSNSNTNPTITLTR
jgi:hypothetical protein